jgi:hypothetical protein
MNGGTVSQSISLGSVATVWSVVGIGDFDGNGNLDILWRDTSGNLAIWFLNSSGVVTSSASLGNVPTNWFVAETGDFDGDGKSDILWRDDLGHDVVWFMNGATVSSWFFAPARPLTFTVESAGAD